MSAAASAVLSAAAGQGAGSSFASRGERYPSPGGLAQVGRLFLEVRTFGLG